jgi:hypothetical protein
MSDAAPDHRRSREWGGTIGQVAVGDRAPDAGPRGS